MREGECAIEIREQGRTPSHREIVFLADECPKVKKGKYECGMGCDCFLSETNITHDFCSRELDLEDCIKLRDILSKAIELLGE